MNTNQSKMEEKTQVLTLTVNEVNFPIERHVQIGLFRKTQKKIKVLGVCCLKIVFKKVIKVEKWQIVLDG